MKKLVAVLALLSLGVCNAQSPEQDAATRDLIAIGVGALAFHTDISGDEFRSAAVAGGLAYGIKHKYPEMTDTRVITYSMIPSVIEQAANARVAGWNNRELFASFVGAYSGVKLGGLIIRPSKGGVKIIYRKTFDLK